MIFRVYHLCMFQSLKLAKLTLMLAQVHSQVILQSDNTLSEKLASSQARYFLLANLIHFDLMLASVSNKNSTLLTHRGLNSKGGPFKYLSCFGYILPTYFCFYSPAVYFVFLSAEF